MSVSLCLTWLNEVFTWYMASTMYYTILFKKFWTCGTNLLAHMEKII